MGGLFAGIFKALGGLLGGSASNGVGSAASTLSSLQNMPTKTNFANMGVDSGAWMPGLNQTTQSYSSSPSIGSLIGASMANSGRGGKGRQMSEQMAQAFAQGPDMSQAQNPMSLMYSLQQIAHPQMRQQYSFAQPTTLMQQLMKLYGGL